MLSQSVNITNPCTCYCNASTGPYLVGAGISSEKTQFPAHLFNNPHHYLTYQNRLTDMLSQVPPWKQLWSSLMFSKMSCQWLLQFKNTSVYCSTIAWQVKSIVLANTSCYMLLSMPYCKSDFVLILWENADVKHCDNVQNHSLELLIVT